MLQYHGRTIRRLLHSALPAKIDFRSDTVTRPNAQMRDAMRNCFVGDDVLSEDPTVNYLEKLAAEMLGKESALFVASGTMGNLLALMTHCPGRSQEVILGDKCHIFLWEQGGSATLAGVHPRALPNQLDGTILPSDIEKAIRAQDPHYPRTKLVCLENTHNRSGGRVLKNEYVSTVSQICKKHGLKLHIDGARLWNASVALNCPPSELVADADSVNVCLSKGLGSPAGSLLVGEKSFIEEARYLRKGIGGGMRQIGVLAACGIVSLSEVFPKQVAQDHLRAMEFAERLSRQVSPECVDLDVIETNMFVFRVPSQWQLSASEFSQKLREVDVLCYAVTDNTLRFVVHYDISDEDIQIAVDRIQSVVDSIQ